jgi:hypothetical protein
VSQYTSKEMRKPPEVVLVYRSFKILLNDFNAIARTFLQTFLNNGTTLLAVVLAFALVKFYGTLCDVELCILVSGITGATTFLILTYEIWRP